MAKRLMIILLILNLLFLYMPYTLSAESQPWSEKDWLYHQQIHIPMFGMGNSLNVSTAGAIVLAECANQIRKLL